MVSKRATWGRISVTWRSIQWGEYRKIRSLQAMPAEKALEVYKLVKLEGPDADTLPSGIMMWIYRYEMEENPFSGDFKKISGPLEQKRQEVIGNYLISVQGFIASVFKTPFAEMDTWDSETLLRRLAQAEFFTGVTLNPTNPDAPTGKLTKKPKKSLTPAQEKAVERRQEYVKSNSYSRGQTAPSTRVPQR